MSVPLSDGGSAAPAKRRRTTARPKPEVAPAEAPVPTLAAPAEPTVSRAAAVEARSAATAVATEPSTNGQGVATEVFDEQEEIARLAYSYWEARGRQGGSPEDDWSRAAEEVRRRRAEL